MRLKLKNHKHTEADPLHKKKRQDYRKDCISSYNAPTRFVFSVMLLAFKVEISVFKSNNWCLYEQQELEKPHNQITEPNVKYSNPKATA